MLQQEVFGETGTLGQETYHAGLNEAYSNLAIPKKLSKFAEGSFTANADKLAFPFEEQCFNAMRSSGLAMLGIFADERSLLDPLKNLVLSVEEEIRKYNIQESKAICADEIDLFGSIDSLETVFYLSEQKQIQIKKNRLKRRLAEWAPSTYLIESALSDFIASEETSLIDPLIVKKLESSRLAYCAHRNRMVQANIRLVYSVANRFRHVGLTYEDLVQEGHLGLIKAVERFDFSKGFRFSTYAHIVISQSIHLAIDKQASLVRLPFKAMREKVSVEKARQKLEQRLGRSPSIRELNRELPDELEYKSTHISNAVEPNASSQQLYSAPDDSELIEERSPFDQDEKTSSLKHSDLVLKLINHLEEREAYIIRMRYGIGLSKEFTLEEISQSIGLSRERVRQLAHHAVEKLGRVFGDLQKL